MTYPKIRIYVDGQYMGSTTKAKNLSSAIALFRATQQFKVRRSIAAVFKGQEA